MIIILIRIYVRPEKRKELSQTLLSIVEEMSKETGCLHSGFYQDTENENDFLFVEEWSTQEDADEHLRSDIFTVIKGTACLMHRPPEIVIHTVSHSTELEV